MVSLRLQFISVFLETISELRPSKRRMFTLHEPLSLNEQCRLSTGIQSSILAQPSQRAKPKTARPKAAALESPEKYRHNLTEEFDGGVSWMAELVYLLHLGYNTPRWLSSLAYELNTLVVLYTSVFLHPIWLVYGGIEDYEKKRGSSRFSVILTLDEEGHERTRIGILTTVVPLSRPTAFPHGYDKISLEGGR